MSFAFDIFLNFQKGFFDLRQTRKALTIAEKLKLLNLRPTEKMKILADSKGQQSTNIYEQLNISSVKAISSLIQVSGDCLYM